jgi:ABC-type nitrate/sulfonate/bicarbonate transport system substrate-binding protein
MLLALAACGGGEEAAAPSPKVQQRTIREFEIPMTQWGQAEAYLPIHVAIVKGFFEEEGLRIKPVFAPGGGASVRAITESAAPLGVATVGATLAAIDAGERLKIVGLLLANTRAEWWTQGDSRFRSLSDLRGARIGYTRPGSASHRMALATVAKAGLRPEDVTLVSTTDLPTGIQMLAERKVDIVLGNRVPSEYRRVLSGEFRVFASWADIAVSLEYAIVAKDSVIQSDPELVRAFMRAVRRGIDYVFANSESPEMLDLFVEMVGARPEDRDVAEFLWNGAKRDLARLWGNYLTVDLDKLREEAENAVALGQLRAVPSDWSRYLDLRFIP